MGRAKKIELRVIIAIHKGWASVKNPGLLMSRLGVWPDDDASGWPQHLTLSHQGG